MQNTLLSKNLGSDKWITLFRKDALNGLVKKVKTDTEDWRNGYLKFSFAITGIGSVNYET